MKNNVDENFYAYNIQHNKEYEYYFNKRHFKIAFIDNQNSTVKSNLFDNKLKISWKNFSENQIDDFENKGYKFNKIEEMDIIRIAIKMDLSHDYYLKHKMHTVEWKITAMSNKNKTLMNNLNRNWTHLLNRKFEKYRVGLL